MIVPMKKVTLITLEKDADSSLQGLRRLGVLHVQYEQAPKGEDINRLQEKVALVNNALAVLSEKEFSSGVPRAGKLSDWEFSAKHIIDLRKRIEQLDEFALNLASRISQWENWGDFNPQEIIDLAKKDIFVRLFQIPLKELNLIPDNVVVKKLFSQAGIVNCVIVSQGKVEMPFKEIPLPKLGLGQLRQRLKEDIQVRQSLKEELLRLLSHREEFEQIKKSLEKEWEFLLALRGMGSADKLVYLTGYVPFDKVEPISSLAKKERWGLVISEPKEEDNPPVLLRNPQWISLINPVYKLLEVVPGYRELDISPLFLLFLALFFGMIIGDAGYGAVYFAITFFAQRKFTKRAKDKTVFHLFYLFSFCALLWGLLTGTVFGQQWYLSLGFKPLVPALNSAKFLMAFCFFLGALHLSLAHGWQALVKLPSQAALADAGFICLLWAGFFLAKMFILGDPFPAVGLKLIWIGITLIILFVSPKKNFLKRLGAGLGTLALGLVGNFGDVVSYIRLFAVGLASVAVADSVNMLAKGAGGNIILQIIILFIGHSINIILGPISVLVHGIRLNVLEFSVLHGNVTWAGLTYRPLRE